MKHYLATCIVHSRSRWFRSRKFRLRHKRRRAQPVARNPGVPRRRRNPAAADAAAGLRQDSNHLQTNLRRDSNPRLRGAVGQPPAGQAPAVGQPGAPGAVT
jgi:hypothetical protein